MQYNFTVYNEIEKTVIGESCPSVGETEVDM